MRWDEVVGAILAVRCRRRLCVLYTADVYVCSYNCSQRLLYKEFIPNIEIINKLQDFVKLFIENHEIKLYNNYVKFI